MAGKEKCFNKEALTKDEFEKALIKINIPYDKSKVKQPSLF